MKEEIVDIAIGMFDYFIKIFAFTKPALVLFSTVFCYVVLPDDAYIPPAIGLAIALFLDIVTKYYAIGRKNGGVLNAIKIKKISSDSFWKGTKKKIVSVLVIMILCGLSIRFTPFLPQIAIGMSTVAYALMFYREAQSVLENLIDAGHDDARWFLSLIKKKRKEIEEVHGLDGEDDQGTK